MTTINTLSMAASVCEQFGIAPNLSVQGSAVPSARLGFVGYPTGLTTATTHDAQTVAAARKDDAQVPDPRGRTL